VQIKHESWCWKQTTHKLNVKAEAETGKSHIQAPEFVHEGYKLAFSPFPTILSLLTTLLSGWRWSCTVTS
jgi:hypothetical protein